MLGVATLLEKNTLKAEHAMAYSTSFSVVMALISLLFLPLANFNLSALSIALIYLLSLMSAAIYWLLARVYKHGSVSAASPVYNALPTFFIVIFAFLFLGEKLTLSQYFFVGVFILATYLIMFTGKPQFESKKYAQWLILASLISAVQATGMKYILLNVNPYTYLIILEAFVALNMIIGMQLKYGGIKETSNNILKYKKEIILIAAFTTAYRVFYYVAASMANITLVWPLSNVLNVIMLVFLGGLIFKEGSVKRKSIIAIAMLIAIYFLVV